MLASSFLLKESHISAPLRVAAFSLHKGMPPTKTTAHRDAETVKLRILPPYLP
nr:MAG TPA: hypothetical protein [Caudoviricetes sp.]